MLSGNSSVRDLCRYNLFNSIAIAPACNLAFMDKLMLHMDLELSFIGCIKGFMFLVPAILYFFMVPILRKLHADVKITLYCYFFRASLPILLPVLALFTDNRAILTAACIFVLSAAMTLAAFANNSLMAIYRMAIPKESFNKNAGLIALCTNIPATTMGLPLAWLLDLCESAPGYWFYIVFALIHVFCVLFEIPAIKSMLKLPPLKYPPAEKHHRIRGAAWRPFADREYLPLLGLCLLNAIVYGIGSAYLIIYLLEERDFSMSMISIIALLLSLSFNLLLPFAGRFADRIGYRRLFLYLSAAMLTGNILFCVFWGKNWVLLPFAILAWTGAGSIVGGVLTWGLNAAGSKLSRPNLSENYIAAFSFCYNGGLFLGSTVAGFLFGLSRAMGGPDIYHRYFLMVLPFPVLLFFCAAIYCVTAQKGVLAQKMAK